MEFPGYYSQDFFKNILKYSQLMSEFTNHDLGPIVVNNLTNILPLKLFRSITIYLSQNVIVVFDLTELSRKKNEKKILTYFF